MSKSRNSRAFNPNRSVTVRKLSRQVSAVLNKRKPCKAADMCKGTRFMSNPVKEYCMRCRMNYAFDKQKIRRKKKVEVK